MRNIFSDSQINTLAYGMDTLSVKNGVIAENIANVDTPGYKAHKLVFDEVMSEYTGQGKKLPLYITNEKHLTPKGFNAMPEDFVRRQNNPSLRNDGNDVNLDYEMSEMGESSVLYQELSQITAGKFTKLKLAIQGR
jgi:flagellar basal-body rod protein FlgB